MDKFDGLVVQADPANQFEKFAEIRGQRWEAIHWSKGEIWYLKRQVKGGSARLEHWQNGFNAQVILVSPERTTIDWRMTFPTLEEAAAAAENYEWEIRKQAGLDWYQTGEEHWEAAIGEGDQAEVYVYGSDSDKRFGCKRKVCPKPGESYEIEANRWGDQSINSFETAVAVALTLPTYVMALTTNTNQSYSS